MSTVRAALIGCGGRLSGIAKLIQRNTDRVQFTGVFDPEPESVRSARERFCPAGQVYASLEEAVNDPNVDWVMVGSPNYLHADHAIAGLRAGKHVFCEKPLATTLDDVMAMKRAWEESDRLFVLGLTLRHSALYRMIRTYIEEGRIGKLISMEFNETLHFNHGGHIHSHPWRRKDALGGSHLLEKCCHDMDLAAWMTDSYPRCVASFGGRNFFRPENVGMIDELGTDKNGRTAFVTWGSVGKRVNPFTGGSDVVDNQVGIIEFDNGVRATFHTNCIAGIHERRMLLLGSRGAIRADMVGNKMEYQRIGFDTKIEQVELPKAIGGHGGSDDILIRDLMATMLDGAPPKASLPEGVASAITCFAMNDAMRKGTVVDCEDYWLRVGMGEGVMETVAAS